MIGGLASLFHSQLAENLDGSEVERIEANKVFGGEPTTRVGQKTASRCIGGRMRDDKYREVGFESGSIDAGFRNY